MSKTRLTKYDLGALRLTIEKLEEITDMLADQGLTVGVLTIEQSNGVAYGTIEWDKGTAGWALTT